jgi:hypothetical protein
VPEMPVQLTALNVMDPAIYAIPYEIMLIVCLAIFLALLLKFPSLRKYRKKRNLVLYAVAGLVLVLTGYHAYDLSLGPTYVSYGIADTSKQFYAIEVNQLDVFSNTHRVDKASFYVDLRAVNASFEVNNDPNDLRVNSTLIKIPFTFQESSSQTKPVLFTMNGNVSSFEFHLAVEEQKDSTIHVTSWMSEVYCAWDSTKQSYSIVMPQS